MGWKRGGILIGRDRRAGGVQWEKDSLTDLEGNGQRDRGGLDGAIGWGREDGHGTDWKRETGKRGDRQKGRETEGVGDGSIDEAADRQTDRTGQKAYGPGI